MKKKDSTVYLKDILNAIEHIEKYSTGGKREFTRQHIKQDAIIRQFAIIGEAVKKLPTSLTKNDPEIPWKKITGMRDILVHDYAQIDIDIVWNAVKQELPPLKRVVIKLMAAMDRKS